MNGAKTELDQMANLSQDEEVVEETTEEVVDEETQETEEIEEEEIPEKEEEVTEEEVIEKKEPEQKKDSKRSALESEAENLRKQNERLLTQVGELNTKLSEIEELSESKIPELTFEDIVVDDDTFNELASDRKALNEVLKKVAKQSALKAIEQVELRIPKIIDRNVQSALDVQTRARDFFEANPDLAPLAKFVIVTYKEMQATNPDRKPEELLGKELADEVRTRLGMRKQTPMHKKGNKKPSFAPAGGTRTPLKPEGKPTIKSEIERMKGL